MTHRTTKAGDWYDARERGERLTEHERPPLVCELCSEEYEPDPDEEAATFWVCAECVERELENASTDEPRAEVGMVGGSH